MTIQHEGAIEHNALERVAREEGLFMYRVAAGILRSHHDAEDAVQDAYVKALTTTTFDPERGSTERWMMRIVQNNALWSLQTKRRRPVPAGDTLAYLHWPQATLRTVSLDRIAIVDAIGALGEVAEGLHGQTLGLVLGGASTTEIATALGISPGAARVRVLRARRAARQAILEETGLEASDLLTISIT